MIKFGGKTAVAIDQSCKVFTQRQPVLGRLRGGTCVLSGEDAAAQSDALAVEFRGCVCLAHVTIFT